MFTEDLAPFLADFGQVATLDGVEVRVIFDRAYVDMMGIASTAPRAGLPTADASAATQASVLEIGGATYRVVSVEPDGTGWTTLILELQ
jgi:hypothetical protein